MTLQFAEITSFFRTLLIIFFIYYLIKFAFKFLFPIFLKKQVEKMKDQQQNAYSSRGNNTKEGETVIDKRPNSQTGNSSKDIGEYVDYEEVD